MGKLTEQRPFKFYEEKYKKLLTKLTARYYTNANKTLFTYEEIYNIALMGLYIGLKTYEEGRGRSLLTHIYTTITYEVFRNTIGRSKKNIENTKFYAGMKSIYEEVSNSTEEILLIDSIPDAFSYEDIDNNIDIQRVYKEVRHIMGEVLEWEEEVILLDLYYFGKSYKEVAIKFNCTEKQLTVRVRRILYILRQHKYIRTIKKRIIEEQIREIDKAYTFDEFILKESLIEKLEGLK